MVCGSGSTKWYGVHLSAAGLQVGVDKRYWSIAAQLALHSMELQQQMWVAVPRFQHV